MFTEEQNELVESAAEMLYGLIHVRYILTTKGMAAMVMKQESFYVILLLLSMFKLLLGALYGIIDQFFKKIVIKIVLF